MFAHLLHTHAGIELDRIHRFTHPWEADASLRLRRGDTGVTQIYETNGRLHGGTRTRMETDAVTAWHHTRQRGETALLAAPTTETVERLNHRAQQLLLDTGHLDPTAGSLTAGAYRLHVGDEVVTRRNDRTLRTDRGHMVRNRDTWTITTLHTDGSLTASGRSGRIRLPADYVASHVELGYAKTSHATQGRTVDHAYLVLDGPCDTRGLYVPLTRGRHSNHAYITTTGEHTAADIFTESLTRTWIDQPAVARRDQLHHDRRAEGSAEPRPDGSGWRRGFDEDRRWLLDRIGEPDPVRSDTTNAGLLRQLDRHRQQPAITRDEPDLGIDL